MKYFIALILLFNNSFSATVTNDFIFYKNSDILLFNTQDFISSHAILLIDYADDISHWSGYYRVNPKILIAVIYLKYSSLNKINIPIYIKNIAKELSLELNLNNSASNSINMISDFIEKYDIDFKTFNQTFFKFFPDIPESSNIIQQKGGTSNILFQLPFPINDSWYAGASHTDTGNGNTPHSSLDFNNGGEWGDSTNDSWVTSSAGGRVKKWSSCFLEIFHDNDWSTTYYHLDNIQVSTGDIVNNNIPLANYANSKNQALCGGGHSDGPHVHFTLKKNGFDYSLNGIKLSGYEVHTSTKSYDTDCNKFWYSQNNIKYCAWSDLYNPGIEGFYIPSKPTNISVTDGNYTRKVNLSDYNNGAHHYYIARASSIIGTKTILSSSFTGSTYSDTTVTPGVYYYYFVKACNSSNICSDYSDYNRGSASVEKITQSEINQIHEQLILTKTYNPVFTSIVNKLLSETVSVETYESELWVYNYKLKISDGDRLGFFMITQIKQPNNQDIINLGITNGYILLIDGNAELKLLLKSHAYKGNNVSVPDIPDPY